MFCTKLNITSYKLGWNLIVLFGINPYFFIVRQLHGLNLPTSIHLHQLTKQKVIMSCSKSLKMTSLKSLDLMQPHYNQTGYLYWFYGVYKYYIHKNFYCLNLITSLCKGTLRKGKALYITDICRFFLCCSCQYFQISISPVKQATKRLAIFKCIPTYLHIYVLLSHFYMFILYSFFFSYCEH